MTGKYTKIFLVFLIVAGSVLGPKVRAVAAKAKPSAPGPPQVPSGTPYGGVPRTARQSNTADEDDAVLRPNLPSIGELLTVVDKATTLESRDGERDWSAPVKLVIVFTLLAILPSLMVMMTSFTRIAIVLGFVRRALATQSIPPNMAIMGLALFLTFYTMAPTFSKMNQEAIGPYLADEINFETAGARAGVAIKEFMLRQSRESDLALFIQMAKIEPPSSPMDVGLYIVIPAFVISEFRTAFEIGCLLFIPFLMIDLVIASILLSAGMMMLPPVMISLPFKLILFILVDGWGLLAKSLSLSFR